MRIVSGGVSAAVAVPTYTLLKQGKKDDSGDKSGKKVDSDTWQKSIKFLIDDTDENRNYSLGAKISESWHGEAPTESKFSLEINGFKQKLIDTNNEASIYDSYGDEHIYMLRYESSNGYYWDGNNKYPQGGTVYYYTLFLKAIGNEFNHASFSDGKYNVKVDSIELDGETTAEDVNYSISFDSKGNLVSSEIEYNIPNYSEITKYKASYTFSNYNSVEIKLPDGAKWIEESGIKRFLKLNISKDELDPSVSGESASVEVTFRGQKITGAELESSSESVATVSDDGIITPVGFGKTTIKAKLEGYDCDDYVVTVASFSHLDFSYDSTYDCETCSLKDSTTATNICIPESKYDETEEEKLDIEILQSGSFVNTSITDVYIPSTVNDIDASAFKGDTSLGNVYIDVGENDTWYGFLDGEGDPVDLTTKFKNPGELAKLLKTGQLESTTFTWFNKTSY